MPLIKSISGIRGTIGNRKGEDLTKDDIVLYTKSFVLWLQSENRIINNEIESKGWFFDNPDKSSICS